MATPWVALPGPGAIGRGIAYPIPGSMSVAADPYGPIIQRWNGPMVTRRTEVAPQTISVDDRAQSLIPVLPWQDGYSYYNNYSSRFADGVSIIVRDKLAFDAATLKEAPLAEKSRLINRTDSSAASEAWWVNGIRVITAADSTLMTETLGQRHGLWGSIAYIDRFSATDTLAARPAGITGKLRADGGSLVDRGWVNLYYATDSAVLNEGGIQRGLRVWTRIDTSTLSESKLLNGRRTFGRPDNGYFFETAELHGRRVFTKTEGASLDETVTIGKPKWHIILPIEHSFDDQHLGVHGKRLWSYTETINVAEVVPPWHFTWIERVKLGETGSLDVRISNPLGIERFTMQDRGSRKGFTVQVEDDEQFSVQTPYRLVSSMAGDYAWMNDRYSRGGILALTRGDQGVLDESWTYQTNRPFAGDQADFKEDYLLNGRRSLLAGDWFTHRTPPTGWWTGWYWYSGDWRGIPEKYWQTVYSVHGKRRVNGYEAFGVIDTSNNPAALNQRENIALLDLPKGVITYPDWMVLADTGYKEDTTQVVRMLDRGILNTRSVVRRDEYAVLDPGWGNSSLNQFPRVRFTERRILERPIDRRLEYLFGERGKLFRKSDFLEPQPMLYDQRPGRVRTALRLVYDPISASTWAVWLSPDGRQVNWARRPYADSWRTHTVVTRPVPFSGARSATLLFTAEGAYPVVHAGDSLHTLAGEGWTSQPGADPVTLDGQLAYLSPDRATLHHSGQAYPLGAQARIDQSFTGPDPGILVYNDLDEVILTLSERVPPQMPIPGEEVASVRWEAPYLAHTAPIEGTVMQDS